MIYEKASNGSILVLIGILSFRFPFFLLNLCHFLFNFYHFVNRVLPTNATDHIDGQSEGPKRQSGANSGESDTRRTGPETAG